MTKRTTRKVHTVSLPVKITQQDIDEGECRNANKCMVRVAVERVLRKEHPRTNHHTRVDAGHIKFNYEGFRYVADTPKRAKHALIQFDREDPFRREAKRAKAPFKSKVEPFEIMVEGRRTTKIVASSAARQEQVNDARKKREAAGQKQKRYTLRERIVGFA